MPAHQLGGSTFSIFSPADAYRLVETTSETNIANAPNDVGLQTVLATYRNVNTPKPLQRLNLDQGLYRSNLPSRFFRDKFDDIRPNGMKDYLFA